MSKITVLLGIFTLFGVFVAFSNFAFAVPENSMPDAKSDFPESIKIGEKVTFSLKMSNLGNYRISDIEPIITIMPKSASKFVHVEINPQISTLWDGFYEITHGTIYVDKGIPVDRIFVSVSFMGKNPFGEQVSLSSDSTFNASIKIEKSQNEEIPSGFVSEQKNNEKLSCTNPNIPLYGCSDAVAVKIDSPLKQIKSGIKWHNVECYGDLVLAEKKGSEKSACVTIFTKIELTVRGWAHDDRVLLGCIGDRVPKCYPDDPKEYRDKLYNYYFGKVNLPSSSDYDFSVLHTINACTDKPWVCYGELDNGTKIRISCDYPIHGCGVKSFDNYTPDRK